MAGLALGPGRWRLALGPPGKAVLYAPRHAWGGLWNAATAKGKRYVILLGRADKNEPE